MRKVGSILVAVILTLAVHQLVWQNPSMHVFDAKATTGASAKSNSSHAVVSALLIGNSKRVGENFSMMAENATSSHEDTSEVLVVTSTRIENEDEHRTATSEKSNTEEIRNNKTNRPYFIFHVGPPKTGTSFLQCGLAALSRDLAELDRYYYLGKPCRKYPLQNNETSPIRGHFLAYELDAGRPDKIAKQLTDRLAYHYTQGNNVIFSVERFSEGVASDEGWEFLKSSLKDWNVRIVVAYRRFYEWVPSLYFQQNHKRNAKSASVIAYTEQKLNSTTAHPASETYCHFAKHFDEVYIFSLHQEGDLLENFVCQALPTANQVCHNLRQGNRTEAAVRVSHSFDAHRLVAAAHKKGLLPSADNRRIGRLSARLDQFQNSNWTEYGQYLKCLSPQSKTRLWNLSLSFEEDVASLLSPDLRSLLSDRQGLVDGFKKTFAKRKYCEIDPERALDANDTFAETILNGV